MALNTLKRNHLTASGLKGLTSSRWKTEWLGEAVEAGIMGRAIRHPNQWTELCQQLSLASRLCFDHLSICLLCVQKPWHKYTGDRHVTPGCRYTTTAVADDAADDGRGHIHFRGLRSFYTAATSNRCHFSGEGRALLQLVNIFQYVQRHWNNFEIISELLQRLK